MQRLVTPVALMGSIQLVSCAPAPFPASSQPVALTEEVRAFEADVMDTYNRGDSQRAAGHYAEDAFVFIPGQPSTTGRTQIAANIARFMEDRNFKLGYENEIIRTSGTLASTRGKLHVTFTDGQTKSARTVTSTYLLVMQKVPESGWQVVEDISF